LQHLCLTSDQPSKVNLGDNEHYLTTLQIILDLCIPEKELAKTRSQISFI
jgi:hypothetical protein